MKICAPVTLKILEYFALWRFIHQFQTKVKLCSIDGGRYMNGSNKRESSMQSSEIEPLDNGHYGQSSVCQCKKGNKCVEKTHLRPIHRQERELNGELSEVHREHRCDNEKRCCLLEQFPLKIILSFSVILNILLVSLLTYILITTFKSQHHHKDIDYRTLRLPEEAVCLPCGNVEAPFPWIFKIHDIQVVMLDARKLCCLRKSKYAQVLMKIMQIVQRNKDQNHAVLKSHLAGIDKRDKVAMSRSLSLKNVKFINRNGIQVKNDTIRIDRSDQYNLYAHLTIHWEQVHGHKNIELSLSRKNSDSREELLLRNSFILKKTTEGRGFYPLTIYESVWLQRGDVLCLDINEPSLIYPSYDSNYIFVIT